MLITWRQFESNDRNQMELHCKLMEMWDPTLPVSIQKWMPGVKRLPPNIHFFQEIWKFGISHFHESETEFLQKFAY